MDRDGNGLRQRAAFFRNTIVRPPLPHMTKDAKAKREKPVPKQENPAGPHARPELTEEEKTPGSGMLPEQNDPNQGPTG